MAKINIIYASEADVLNVALFGLAQKDRLIKLNAVAIQQMKLLTDDHGIKKLEGGK